MWSLNLSSKWIKLLNSIIRYCLPEACRYRKIGIITLVGYTAKLEPRIDVIQFLCWCHIDLIHCQGVRVAVIGFNGCQIYVTNGNWHYLLHSSILKGHRHYFKFYIRRKFSYSYQSSLTEGHIWNWLNNIIGQLFC